jgi:hypothetical protein
MAEEWYPPWRSVILWVHITLCIGVLVFNRPMVTIRMRTWVNEPDVRWISHDRGFTQARASCAPSRGTRVDSSQAVDHRGIDHEFSQADSLEHHPSWRVGLTTHLRAPCSLADPMSIRGSVYVLPYSTLFVVGLKPSACSVGRGPRRSRTRRCPYIQYPQGP